MTMFVTGTEQMMQLPDRQVAGVKLTLAATRWSSVVDPKPTWRRRSCCT
jgi:hypothetical protein